MNRGAETETERALAMMAYIVLRHGDAYAPLLDRLEREVEEERRRSSHTDRARRILASMSIEASPARAAGKLFGTASHASA